MSSKLYELFKKIETQHFKWGSNAGDQHMFGGDIKIQIAANSVFKGFMLGALF